MTEDYAPFEDREEHDLIRSATVDLIKVERAVKHLRAMNDVAFLKIEESVNDLREAVNSYAMRSRTIKRKEDENNSNSA